MPGQVRSPVVSGSVALAVALSVVLSSALSGCSRAATTPSPTTTGSAAATPGASYTCSPIGGTPTPCSPEQYTQEQAQAQLAEEAKRGYRRLVSELAALQRAGGATTPSPELTQTAGGAYLAAQQATLTRLSQLKARVSGEVRIATLTAAAGGPAKGFDTALLACVDSTKAKVLQGTKELQKGQLVAEVVYFRRDGDTLKAWDAEKADPKRC